MKGMENKILIILGFLLMIGLVSGSSQTYDVEVTLSESDNDSEDILLSYTLPQSGAAPNPIDFELSVNYNDTDALNCRLEIDGRDVGTGFFDINTNNFELGEINLSSDNDINWNVTCYDDTKGIEGTTSGTFDIIDFSISGIDNFYWNDFSVSGDLSYQGNPDIELYYENENTPKSCDITTENSFTIPQPCISEPGEYHLIAREDSYGWETEPVYFYVGEASVEFDDPEVGIDEKTIVNADVNFGGAIGGDYSLFVGKGNGGSDCETELIVGFTGVGNGDDFSSDETGTYCVKLIVDINDQTHVFYDSLTVSGTASATDDEDPVLTLIYPLWGDIVYDENVTFEYQIEDETSIDSCEFRIYNATNSTKNSPLNNLLVYEYEQKNFTGKKDTISVPMYYFDERAYQWEVWCEDEAGNYDADFMYFYVDLTGTYSAMAGNSGYAEYERESEVQDLIDKINSFLEAEDSFGINEKKAVGLLGIGADMNLYKKKLLQIDQDLKYNLRFMSADKYEKRVEEIDEEIDEIKENVVVGITVSDSYEYSKNNPGVSIEGIIESYFEATGHSVGGGTLKRLARSNEEIQDKLSSRIEAIKLEVEYSDKTEEVIVVNKMLELKTGFQDSLLEFIPEDLGEDVYFISDAESVGNGIWEIDIAELDDSQLTYYFYSDTSLQNIEKTESVLFSEDMGEGSFITGFVTGVGDSFGPSIIPILIGALFMGYVGFVIFGKARLEVWKKEPNVVRILDLMKNTKLLLRENNIVDARANYVKMGEIYKVLPNKTKSFFFNEIKMIRLAIDKKDVINLMKEYEKAKNEGRIQDASELHAKISAVYKKLPKKFQEKVYQRLIKNEVK